MLKTREGRAAERLSSPNPRDRMLTKSTLASLDLDVLDLVPSTLNDHLLTSRTVRAFSLVPGNISYVDVMNPLIERDAMRSLQSGDGCGRKIFD